MKELDCLGLRCPLPIIAIGKEIKKISAGGSIRLLSDDPATEIDLRAWSRMTGHQIKVMGNNEFLVTKSEMN